MRTKTVFVILWLGIVGAITVLACAAQATNMTVEGTPRAVCPSSTPRPTYTPLPPDPPTYPAYFAATLDYNFVDSTRNVIQLQYIAQHVGEVRVTLPDGQSAIVAVTGSGPGVGGTYPIYMAPTTMGGTIYVTAGSFSASFLVYRYVGAVGGTPAQPPCCLPAPIYPTPRPTHTPWPTPTLYQLEAPQAFPLEVPVRNESGPVRLMFRMKAIWEKDFPIVPLFTAATWELEISNIGPVEFDFIGALQTYVSEVDWLGSLHTGIWSPAHQAAQFMGIVEQAYNPTALRPGETITVRVSAWIPQTAHVTKVNFILNVYQAGDPGFATFTPGQERLLIWQNRPDSNCPAW